MNFSEHLKSIANYLFVERNSYWQKCSCNFKINKKHGSICRNYVISINSDQLRNF